MIIVNSLMLKYLNGHTRNQPRCSVKIIELMYVFKCKIIEFLFYVNYIDFVSNNMCIKYLVINDCGLATF